MFAVGVPARGVGNAVTSQPVVGSDVWACFCGLRAGMIMRRARGSPVIGGASFRYSVLTLSRQNEDK